MRQDQAAELRDRDLEVVASRPASSGIANSVSGTPRAGLPDAFDRGELGRLVLAAC